MIEFYAEIRMVHMGAVYTSGALFLLRWLLSLSGVDKRRYAPLNYLSYAVDTVLLTAALMLMTIVRQYPFVHGWLTTKVVLLVVYIVLGVFALRAGTAKRSRAAFGVAALAVYGFIISVARAHHPLGIFTKL